VFDDVLQAGLFLLGRLGGGLLERGSEGDPRDVIFLDRLLDLGLGGQHHLDVASRHELQIVGGEDVQGIGHGDGQHVPLLGDGDQRLMTGHGFGDQVEHGRRDVAVFGQGDVGGSALAAQESQEHVLAAIVQFLEDVPQFAAGGLLHFQRFVQLVLGDDADFDQDVPQLLFEGSDVFYDHEASPGWTDTVPNRLRITGGYGFVKEISSVERRKRAESSPADVMDGNSSGSSQRSGAARSGPGVPPAGGSP